ncbi:sialidase family protein [Brachyspira pilosicoli]|uniref:sialidase family protein n=2 Tax=Brachyspira pilosicoli TaxID=52584 RepID=UPI0030048825
MKKLLFILALIGILISISCSSVYFPQSVGLGVKKGTGGGQIVGIGYVLHEGSLSLDEQKRNYDPNENSITLFKKGDFGSKYFRIPSLLVTAKGTILAATDRRYDDVADLGKDKTRIDVLLRRSEDLGTTWSDPIVVGPGAGDDPGDRSKSYGDAFMINCHNGDIILGCIAEPGIQDKNPKGKTILFRSKDDGITWNQIYEFYPSEVPNAKRGFGASGQGLTLRHGQNASAKKLMFAYFQWNNDTKNGGLSVTAIVSDNDGSTWAPLGSVTPSPDNDIDETKAIELSDGRIMLNHRKGTKVGGRAWSISSDGGLTWEYQGIDPEVNDPGNNADFFRYEYNGKRIKTEKYILMINANATPNGKWFFTRKNHYVRLTENEFDNGKGTSSGKYAYSKQLVNGGENLYSGYPTIAVLPDGTICTLTEETWQTTRPPELTGDAGGDDYDIVFRRFNLYWLTDGKEFADYTSDYLFQQPQN